MKLGFKILAPFAVAFALLSPVKAASILPTGKTQIVDANGAPCVGCKLYFYIPNSTVPKDTWEDSAQTILNTNPVVLDSLGTAIIYGTGVYRQILKDATGTTLWDALTADQVSLNASWAGISAGSANAQTVILNNFSLQDGQLVYFLAGISNTGPMTLNVSGTGNVSVVLDTSIGPQALGGGEVTVGNVIGMVYDATAGVFHIVTPTPIQSFNGAIFFNGFISPTILASDQNDWTPTGGFSGANTLRISSSGPVSITGLAGGAAGRTVIFHNVGTNTITFIPNDGASLAANRFLMSAPVSLRGNEDFVLQYDGISSGWRRISPHTANPTSVSFKNLRVANGATPNNQVIGTADEFTVEDANGVTVRLRSPSCTADVTTTGTFTATTGSLDTGTVATNTWYAYFFIYNAATNTQSCLLSTSATAPTLPTGFTFFGRASWNRTNGSSQFARVLQYGRRAQYVVSSSITTIYPIITSGVVGTFNTTTFTGVSTSVASAVPTTASVIKLQITTQGGGTNAAVAPNNNFTGYQTSTPPPIFNSAGTVAIQGDFILEAAAVFFASTSANNNLTCIGWEDNL